MTEKNLSDRFTSITATAGQTVLAWDFELLVNEGMTVLRLRDGVTARLSEGDDYTFPGGIGAEAGGTLTLAQPAQEGDIYQMIGLLPETRQSDFLATKAFVAAKFNSDLDRLTQIAQEHRRDIGRAWKAGYGAEGKRIDAVPPGHFHMADEDGNLVDAGLALPLPAGGAEGQVLQRTAGPDGSAAWTSNVNGGGDMLSSAYDPRGVGADAFDSVNQAAFTRADVVSKIIPATVSALRTSGYANHGDGGGALYKRVLTEPAHAGKFQSADGAWWEMGLSIPTVEMFGAVGDGMTDDTAAFQAAIDALPPAGGTIQLQWDNYAVTIASLETGGREIFWLGGDKINGNIYRNLPGLNESFNADNNRYVHFESDTVNRPFVRHDFYRKALYAGGESGVHSTVRVFSEVADSVGSGGEVVSEWALQTRADNNSDYANVVASTGQIRRNAKGPSWAGHFNAIDNIDAGTSARAIWGFEANIQGNGADLNILRRVGGIIAHNVDQIYSGTPGTDVIGTGLDIYPDTADFAYGIRIRTIGNPGVTKGEFRQAALRIDAKANDLIQALHPSAPALVKIGSKNSTGIVSQIIGVGNNSAGVATNYVDARSEIDVNTAGSENGRWRLYAAKAGVMTEFITVNAGAGAPIRVNVSGTLKPVTEGAADSGGAGYRVLRVPNA